MTPLFLWHLVKPQAVTNRRSIHFAVAPVFIYSGWDIQPVKIKSSLFVLFDFILVLIFNLFFLSGPSKIADGLA